MALRLVADGVDDTYVPRAHASAAYFPAGLALTPFRPIVYETFAIISRRGTRLSRAVEAFATGIQAHMLSPERNLEPL